MKITDQVARNIISRLLKSQDYRIEIVNILNAEFLQFTIDFFKKIISAKLDSQDITIDWYKKHFLSPTTTSTEDIIIHSGLNKKTISNMYGSANKQIVIDASSEHFSALYDNIEKLVELENNELDIYLTIKFKNASVELNISESLIVINTLAVKRSQLRGGLWSTAGKTVEKPLMLTLCHLYKIPKQYYNATTFVKNKGKKVDREIDFYLIDQSGKQYLCEVKLMGKGNPESADAIIARNTDIFIADTLSKQNKNQCDELNVKWVALREQNGFAKFEEILQQLQIPHKTYQDNLKNLDSVLDIVFSE
ncbi:MULTISPECIES: CfrBI family restriction endonuclease [unclassified Moraxella]|uniref:CfrBI family restriction endonuclease n=1 Tax=unclassified Moraxella TaxID=2685852 RepID=UPI002B40B836|nr:MULTISPECIES: CfrBI family restriction endonuclease [unclassified Moraxella]